MAKYEIHRADGPQSAIVKALRKAGVSVAVIDRPVDLLCGRGGANYLMEVKSVRGRLSRSQKAFQTSWRGTVIVVRTVEEALRVVGCYNSNPISTKQGREP